MAFLGFGSNEDEYYEQPQKASFLSNVGSMIWSGLKMAFFAALAVVTLGTVFTMSETATNFVDKYTGGEGKGLATTIKSWMNKIVDPVKDFINPSPKDEKPLITSVSATKSEKIGEADVLLANPALSNSPITKSRDINIEDINGRRRQLDSAMTSDQERITGNKELNKNRAEAMQYLKAVEEWNHSVVTKGNELIPGAPQARAIPLNLPSLGRFEGYGAEKFKGTWESASPVQKIELLENSIGLSTDPLKKPAALLPADPIRIPELKTTGDVNDITSVHAKLFNQNASKTSKNTHNVIANLIEEGRFPEATLVANTIIDRLEKEGKGLPNNKKSEGAEYRKAIESLIETRDYTVKLQDRKELDPILNQTYKAANDAAAVVPIKIAAYEQGVANYRKTVELAKALEKGSSTTTDATTLPPPPKDNDKAVGAGRQ